MQFAVGQTAILVCSGGKVRRDPAGQGSAHGGVAIVPAGGEVVGFGGIAIVLAGGNGKVRADDFDIFNFAPAVSGVGFEPCCDVLQDVVFPGGEADGGILAIDAGVEVVVQFVDVDGLRMIVVVVADAGGDAEQVQRAAQFLQLVDDFQIVIDAVAVVIAGAVGVVEGQHFGGGWCGQGELRQRQRGRWTQCRYREGYN